MRYMILLFVLLMAFLTASLWSCGKTVIVERPVKSTDTVAVIDTTATDFEFIDNPDTIADTVVKTITKYRKEVKYIHRIDTFWTKPCTVHTVKEIAKTGPKGFKFPMFMYVLMTALLAVVVICIAKSLKV